MRRVNLEVMIQSYQENYGQLVAAGDKAKLEFVVLYVLHIKLGDPSGGKSINSKYFLDMCRLSHQDVTEATELEQRKSGGFRLFTFLLDRYVRRYGEPNTVFLFDGGTETLFDRSCMLEIVRELMLEINEDDREKAKTI